MQEKTNPAQETIPTSTDESSDGKIPWKKILIGLGAFILVLAIGGISYLLGKQSKSTEEPTPTPIPALTPFETPEPTLSPTSTPTVSAELTPTTTVTPTSTPEIKTKTISSTASLDGFRSSNGGGNAGVDIRAGRNIYLVTRGFVSFDLADIPEGATITQATLRLYQYKIIGNPYGVGGTLKVDHLNYGGSLENADYAASAILSSFATLTINSAIEWKDASVTDRVKDDLANDRKKSQFRIHFTTETTGGDATGDFAYFESAENTGTTGNTPQLVVKYY